MAPPETRAFFCSSTLCARMLAIPKALPLWSAELRTKRLDQMMERLDSGLRVRVRACAAGGGRRRSRDTISVYCDIAYIAVTSETISRFSDPDIRISQYFLQYQDHIGPDIGNIGFGKEQVCPDIVLISAPILPISGPISRKMTRYRVLVTRYRKAQYRDTP